jgi:hypothetical protein
MPLVVPNTIEVRLNWTLSDQTWATNVLHYVVPTGFSVNQTNAESIATFVDDAYSDTGSWRSQVTSTVGLDSVGVRDIRTANQPEFIGDVTGSGGNVSSIAPRQLSVVLTLRTALAGGSFRGRVYLCGCSTGGIDTNGDITDTAAQRAEVFGDGLISTTVDSSLLILGVTSRSLGVTTPVDRVEVRDRVWDWQRSRATIG